MSVSLNNNYEAQAANQINNESVNSLKDVSSEKGQFGARDVIANTDVDPTTKDDECASNINAEKKALKERKKEAKENNKNKLNALQKAKENQNINEQDQRGRRITKNTENLLKSIGQFVSKNLSTTIQERSQKLFDGSEKLYQECFNELDRAMQQRNCTSDKISQALRRFDDVSEQHNALQIAIDVYERKLTNLKALEKNLPSDKEVGAQAKQQDQEEIQQQIRELEKNINTIKLSQGDLMAKQGSRIGDSYILAPLLRETTAHFTHDITLPPKDFNAIILDEILILKGDPAKTFNCLTKNLIENLKPSSGSAVEHFKNNLDVVKKCLSQELKCCPTSISAVILNTIRSMEKFDTVQIQNAKMVEKLTSYDDINLKSPVVS